MTFDESKMQHGYDWSGQDLTGWIVTEKFDGCRAYWNGAELWTRRGNVIQAPRWFLDEIPKGVHLDGEIWAGRGNLQTARVAVQNGRFDNTIKFKVFDMPCTQLSLYEARLNIARACDSSVVDVVIHHRVHSRNHLLELFAAVKTANGEGLIAHKPESYYVKGRTFDILKIKHDWQFNLGRQAQGLRTA